MARTLVALHEVGQAAGASSMNRRSCYAKRELTSTRPDRDRKVFVEWN